MEETYLTKTIILNRKPFREYDSKLTIYSKERGKIYLVARGARKIKSKLSGHIEPISCSNVMIIRGRNLDYAGSAFNINNFKNLKNDYDKIICAAAGLNFVEKMVKEGEGDERIFCLLKNYLEFLDNTDLNNNYSLLFNFFKLKIFDFLGYRPELYNCVICKNKIKTGGNKIDSRRGGIVCASCKTSGSLTISDDCIKVLRLGNNYDFIKLFKIKMEESLKSEAIKIISSFHSYNFN